jgi:hypothetical protein
MKQWIIDRYNKGQDKYFLKNIDYSGFDIVVRDKQNIYNFANLEIYNFLFNPKWGFAKAFWGDKEVTACCGEEYDPDKICCSCWNYANWLNKHEYYLQQMAISKDPLEYLEQFKD